MSRGLFLAEFAITQKKEPIITTGSLLLLNNLKLLVKSFDCLNLAVLVVLQLADFQASQPSLVVRWNAVVMEQIPFAFVLGNGVVSGPAHNRCQNHALIGERSVRIVADCVAKEVAVAS